MMFRGFKITVTVNFAVLLIAGMMLINIVVTIFWYQHIISSSIKNSRLFLTSLAGDSFLSCEILSSANSSQLNAKILIYPDLSTPVEDSRSEEMEMALRQSAVSRTEVIRTAGSFFSLFGLSPRQAMIAIPVKKCEAVKAIGTIVHIPEISKDIINKQSIIFVYILVNAIILTTLWFFRMRRLVIEPLEDLVDMTDSFGGYSFDLLEKSSKKNEFGQLATALRNMLTRIDEDKKKLSATVNSLETANKQILANQDKLIEAEKFVAVGRLSAGLAHEIGNPLGIVQGYLELLGSDDIEHEDRLQYTGRAIKELERMTRLIRQLLNFAQKKNENESRTPVAPVIYELLEMFKYQKIAENIQLDFQCEDFAEQVCCSEADLHQVLLNCILNSIDAIGEQGPATGSIVFSCSLVVEEDKKFAAIEIRDNGGGVERSDMSSVFDPFFTTKEIGHGTGLGLSVSRSIVENCGGTIRLESENSTGTCVIITLPVE